MTDDYAHEEKLLKQKHELEWANLNARRELEAARRSGLDVAGQFAIALGPDPLEIEAATLKENQSRELLEFVKKRLAGGKLELKPPTARRRFGGTVYSPPAARKMESFVERQGIGFTEFAIRANTTDRTLRSFRKTGKVRRDIFNCIAKSMNMKPEDLVE